MPDVILPIGGFAQNWQRKLRTRLDRLGHIYDYGVLSDVIFIVGKDKTRIKAHKLILMMSSWEFEKMFESGLGHTISSTSKKTEVVVEDIKPGIFETMLRFIYRGDFAIGTEDINSAMNLIVAANRYKIEELQRQCMAVIIANTKEENVLSIHHLAHVLGIKELMDYSFEFICRNASNIFKPKEALTVISRRQLEEFLKSDDLNMDEIELFHFVMKWAKEACRIVKHPPSSANVKSMTEKLIPHIRFGLMSPSEITLHVQSQNLFSNDELVSMYVLSSVSPSRNNNNKPSNPQCNHSSTHFPSSKKRLTVGYQHRNRFGTVSRFTSHATSDYLGIKTRGTQNKPTWQCISFSTNTKIRVVGITIFGIACVMHLGEPFSRNVSDFMYEVRILNPTCEVLARQNDCLKLVGETVYVKLNSPVEIDPGVFYTVAATVKSFHKTVIGNGGLTQIKVPWMEKDVSFTFKAVPQMCVLKHLYGGKAVDSGNSTDVNVGEFPSISFQLLE